MNKQFPQFGGFPTIPKMNARLEMHPKGVPGLTPQWVVVQSNGMILEHTRSDKMDDAVTKYRVEKITQVYKRNSHPSWKTMPLSFDVMLEYASRVSADCFLLIEQIMNEPIDGYNMIGDQIYATQDEPPLQYTSRKDVLASIMKDE